MTPRPPRRCGYRRQVIVLDANPADLFGPSEATHPTASLPTHAETRACELPRHEGKAHLVTLGDDRTPTWVYE